MQTLQPRSPWGDDREYFELAFIKLFVFVVCHTFLVNVLLSAGADATRMACKFILRHFYEKYT